jgi:periplasmic divalent cation tolerance protein
MTGTDLVEVTITAPDPDWLTDLCRQLVDARLASSAHVIHPITSIYRWEGTVHDATEARAFLRSRRDLVTTSRAT